MAVRVGPNQNLQQPHVQEQAQRAIELDQNQIDGIFIQATASIQLETLRRNEAIDALNQRIDRIQESGRKTCCEVTKEFLTNLGGIIEPAGKVVIPIAEIAARLYPIVNGATDAANTNTIPTTLVAAIDTIQPAT